MTPRPMRMEEDAAVRHIFAACHPLWPPRGVNWYTAYPTLVVARDGELVGFTSFSVSPSPAGPTTLYGNDLCVLPIHQGEGIGWALAETRLAIGRAVGATTFIGVTEDSNKSMIHIFERQGFHPCQRLTNYFPTGDAVVWAGSL